MMFFRRKSKIVYAKIKETSRAEKTYRWYICRYDNGKAWSGLSRRGFNKPEEALLDIKLFMKATKAKFHINEEIEKSS